MRSKKKMQRLVLVFAVLFETFFSFAAKDVFGADEIQTAPPSDIQEVEKPKTLHEALDRRYRFSKKLQSEISVFGGDYLGDEWYNTWDVGARYYLHINNSFAIGSSYRYSPVRTDSTGVFGQSLKTKNTHTIDGEIMYSNECAFRGGDTVVECDFFLTAGAGAIEINKIWGAAGVFGGGLKIYTPAPFFAVRFDVDAILHNTPKPGGDSFNSDMAMELGVSFLIPVKRANQSDGL